MVPHFREVIGQAALKPRGGKLQTKVGLPTGMLQGGRGPPPPR